MPAFKANHYVFVDKLTMVATAELSIDAIPKLTCRKQQQCTVSPSQIANVNKNLMIDDSGIFNTVVIDCNTHHLTHDKIQYHKNEDARK